MVSVITTAIAPDTPLATMRYNGEFIQLTEQEAIYEELNLLEQLELKDGDYFFGNHLNNLIGVGNYFKYKDQIINKIKEKLDDYEINRKDTLDSKLNRYLYKYCYDYM